MFGVGVAMIRVRVETTYHLVAWTPVRNTDQASDLTHNAFPLGSFESRIPTWPGSTRTSTQLLLAAALRLLLNQSVFRATAKPATIRTSTHWSLAPALRLLLNQPVSRIMI
jgi:hypothetical protein